MDTLDDVLFGCLERMVGAGLSVDQKMQANNDGKKCFLEPSSIRLESILRPTWRPEPPAPLPPTPGAETSAGIKGLRLCRRPLIESFRGAQVQVIQRA